MDVRRAVEELLVRMESGDHERAAKLFSESVDFMCAGRAPWIKPRKNRADMAQFFREMDAAFVPDARFATLTGLLVDGRDAMVTGYVTQRLRSNGETFEIPFALHLTVSEKGDITRYHVYEDSLTVAEAIVGSNIG